ncbi:hypothetical protein ACWEOE_10695 [Amycolatopsis sp. NPDC004368]
MSEFTCPGLLLPQPEDAPPEGYVACYRAGHVCDPTKVEKSDEKGTCTEYRCRCCGDLYVSQYIPHEMKPPLEYRDDETHDDIWPKECYACLVGVATGPESHDADCPVRDIPMPVQDGKFGPEWDEYDAKCAAARGER